MENPAQSGDYLCISQHSRVKPLAVTGCSLHYIYFLLELFSKFAVISQGYYVR